MPFQVYICRFTITLFLVVTAAHRLEYVAVIQDDILITGLDDNHHLSNLEKVLQRLDRYGLRLKLEKCKFMQPSVTYMGVELSVKGISPNEEKVKAIKDAPTPENSTQLRAFLGMVNYHIKLSNPASRDMTAVKS